MSKKNKKPQTRINVRSILNTEGAHQETLNGRQVMVVQSATLPDDVIMNDILYPADEIRYSYFSLNRTPAPLGHPLIDGKFVSASDPEGINLGWCGAWNDNAEQKDGRVHVDKIIDIEIANQSEGGKRLLNKIKKGDPIHTSTGLYCNLEEVEHDDYRFIARNLYFDHDAILLDEEGEATPEQGVGMLVNKKGERKEINVINSDVVRFLGDDIDWASNSDDLFDVDDENGIIHKLTAALKAVFGNELGKTTNQGDNEMSEVKQEAFDALEEKVNGLASSVEKIEADVGGIGETITNAVAEAVKPVTESLAEIQNKGKADEEAEKEALINKVVEAKLRTEDEAKELSLDVLNALASTIKEPKKAAPITGTVHQFAPTANSEEDSFKDYDMNAAFEDEKKEA